MLLVVGSAAERAHQSSRSEAVVRRPTEDHDHLYHRGTQPRRCWQTHLTEGRELAGFHVALTAEASMGRKGAGLLCQHL